MKLVNHSVYLSQNASAFPEIDITALVFDFEVMVVLEDPLLHLVIDKCAHVEMWDFDDDFKSDEVDDAMLDSVLIGQHVDVQELGNEIDDMRGVGDMECQVWMLKVIYVVVDVFHQVHCVGDLWV